MTWAYFVYWNIPPLMGGMMATSSPLESWSPCPGSQYSWFRETMRLPLRVAISPKDRTTSARSCSGVVEAVRVRDARSTPARSRAPAKKRMVTDTSRSVIPPATTCKSTYKQVSSQTNYIWQFLCEYLFSVWFYWCIPHSFAIRQTCSWNTCL